jgi:hypothetical protein
MLALPPAHSGQRHLLAAVLRRGHAHPASAHVVVSAGHRGGAWLASLLPIPAHRTRFSDRCFRSGPCPAVAMPDGVCVCVVLVRESESSESVSVGVGARAGLSWPWPGISGHVLHNLELTLLTWPCPPCCGSPWPAMPAMRCSMLRTISTNNQPHPSQADAQTATNHAPPSTPTATRCVSFPCLSAALSTHSWHCADRIVCRNVRRNSWSVRVQPRPKPKHTHARRRGQVTHSSSTFPAPLHMHHHRVFLSLAGHTWAELLSHACALADERPARPCVRSFPSSAIVAPAVMFSLTHHASHASIPLGGALIDTQRLQPEAQRHPTPR